MVKFGGIFAVTQIPLAVSEGLLTVLLWNWLKAYSPQELSLLKRGAKGGNTL
ncbi:cobalt transport protein CbiM [compost metagenome]